MSEIPPAPNPVPHQEPPTITPLTPSWSYPFNILLLLAGVIVALVVVYLTYRLLVKNRSASNGRLTALHGFAILIGGSESTILPRAHFFDFPNPR